MNTTDNKTLQQICLVSRQGVCLLDMQQVIDTAENLNLTHLARLVHADLEANKITTGEYYRVLQFLYGASQ